MNSESKPVDFKGAVAKFEAINEREEAAIQAAMLTPEKPTGKFIKRAKRMGAVAAVSAGVVLGGNQLSSAINQQEDSQASRSGDIPAKIEAQRAENAVQAAAAQGQNPENLQFP